MKKLLFIYNLQAGKGRARSRLPNVLDILTQAGWLVTVHPTQSKSDATAVAADLGGQYDRVVCCGGDGTLHETITGLMTLAVRPDVGYLPAGTTNDFSRNLHLPRGFERVAAVAAAGTPRPCDIGRFNDRFFVYVAAFGAFTDVSYDTPQQFKNMFGHLAYLLEGVTRLTSIQSYHLTVEHDGGVLEGDYIFGMVSNTVSVGGFRSVPSNQVKLDDGLFEVVLVQQPTNMAELHSIARSLARMTPDEVGAVIGLHTAHLKVTSNVELPWTLDGEYGGAPKITEIENCNQAVTIIHGA